MVRPTPLEKISSQENKSPHPEMTQAEKDAANFAAAGQINPQRFKTKMCRAFMNGQLCPFEGACAFAHGENELRRVLDNVAMGIDKMEINSTPTKVMRGAPPPYRAASAQPQTPTTQEMNASAYSSPMSMEDSSSRSITPPLMETSVNTFHSEDYGSQSGASTPAIIGYYSHDPYALGEQLIVPVPSKPYSSRFYPVNESDLVV